MLTIDLEFQAVIKTNDMFTWAGQEVTVFAEADVLENCDCDGRNSHPHVQDVRILEAIATDEDGDEQSYSPHQLEFEDEAVDAAYDYLEGAA